MLTIAIDQSLLSWLNLSLIKQGRTVKTTLYNICIQWLIRQHSTNIPPLDNMYTLWSSIEHASISGVLNIINWAQDEREIYEWCSIDIKLYERLPSSKNVTTRSYIKMIETIVTWNWVVALDRSINGCLFFIFRTQTVIFVVNYVDEYYGERWTTRQHRSSR